MLAAALVASTGKLDCHVAPPVLSIREASTPRRWVAIAILGIEWRGCPHWLWP